MCLARTPIADTASGGAGQPTPGGSASEIRECVMAQIGSAAHVCRAHADHRYGVRRRGAAAHDEARTAWIRAGCCERLVFTRFAPHPIRPLRARCRTPLPHNPCHLRNLWILQDTRAWLTRRAGLKACATRGHRRPEGLRYVGTLQA